MGMFERLFRRQNRRQAAPDAAHIFGLLNGYNPVFTTWDGSIYESLLVRASIDAIARSFSKLRVVMHGAAKPSLRSRLKVGPNPWQTYSQWLAQTATILLVNNTAFVLPVLDEDNEQIGFYTIAPNSWEIVEDDEGTLWLRFHFDGGKTGAMELYRTGILVRHQYDSDYFGSSNSALDETMQLIHLQTEGIEAGVKNAASYRFMARFNSVTPDPKDLIKERLRFAKQNFGDAKKSGPLLLFPANYSDIKQLEAQTVTVDPKQQEQIKDNIYSYYGVNNEILQGKAYGDVYSAWYETTIEPLVIQLAEVMTRMTYTRREQVDDNGFYLTTGRLQFMTIDQKQRFIVNNLDRGLITYNEARDVLQLPPLQGEAGNVRPIRGEYYNADTGEKISAADENNTSFEHRDPADDTGAEELTT